MLKDGQNKSSSEVFKKEKHPTKARQEKSNYGIAKCIDKIISKAISPYGLGMGWKTPYFTLSLPLHLLLLLSLVPGYNLVSVLIFRPETKWLLGA